MGIEDATEGQVVWPAKSPSKSALQKMNWVDVSEQSYLYILFYIALANRRMLQDAPAKSTNLFAKLPIPETEEWSCL